jgi:cytochrome c553
MSRLILIAGVAVFLVTVAHAQSTVPPPWAYTVNPPPTPSAKPAPADPAPRTIPGSALSLTVAQTRDAYNPPDWFPDTHPPMPDSVAHGRPKEMRACGFCHLVNGQGRPENASLAGLPAAYIIQQMADFKNGDRKSAEPRMGPPNAMIQDAKAATDEDIRTAAAYFSSFPFKRWIRVVESMEVPKTRIAGSMHVPTNEGGEPLGRRIIEIPENLERTGLRRLRADRQHRARRSAGEDRRQRQDRGVRHLSWRHVEGSRTRPAAGRPIPELHRAPVVRYAAGGAQGRLVGVDEGGR